MRLSDTLICNIFHKPDNANKKKATLAGCFTVHKLQHC